MEKGDRANKFIVAQKETVTIRTKSISVGQFATASRPAMEVTPDGSNEQVFEFDAEGEPGEIEGIVLACDFPEPPPPQGIYEIEVSGSNGGTFPAGKVRQSSRATGPSQRDRAFLFILS
jgi:hypothetical protein